MPTLNIRAFVEDDHLQVGSFAQLKSGEHAGGAGAHNDHVEGFVHVAHISVGRGYTPSHGVLLISYGEGGVGV